MPQFRKDPVNGRWVIINMEAPRLSFPVKPHVKSSKTCPFCPGNEAMTANEIAVYAFLEEKISFLKIPEMIEKTISKTSFIRSLILNLV